MNPTEESSETEDSCVANEETGVDFRPLDFSGEIEDRPGGSPSMLFDSLDSSVCADGSQRIVISMTPQDGGPPGEIGISSELLASVQLESGETADIESDQVLSISLNGVTWDPSSPENPETPVAEGGVITDVEWHGSSGGSASLLVGTSGAREFRAFTLGDPYRLVVDLRP